MPEPVAGRITFMPEIFSGKGVFKEEPGDRIKSAGTPGVASRNSFRCQPTACKRPMHFQGINGIG